MASITTRQTGTTGTDGVTRKNLPLTNTEIDNNFISLNNNKLETSFTGNTSIVTLGTVTTGTWNATTIAANRGGTGVTSSTGNGNLLIGNSSNGWTVAALTGTSNRITVTNGSGSITISTPQDINTSSNPQFGSLGIGQAASGTAGELRATTITETSSIVYKENINPIQNALEAVTQLNGVTYDRKDGSRKMEAGLIAEDVFKILPNLVTLDSSGKVDGITYTKIVSYLIEAIKELKTEIDTLKGVK